MKPTSFPSRALLPLISLGLLAGCGGGAGGESSSGGNTSSALRDYVGTWVASCTTAAPTSIYTLSINASGQYGMLTREYDSSENCGNDDNILYSRIDTASVTSIEANAANADYNDLYISNSAVRMTPHSSEQVSSWISSVQCNKTDWNVGTEAEFTATSNDNGCFQLNSRPAVQVNASSLSMNGRGGFDGADPDDTLFSKQSSSALLMGKIGGEAWIAVSGKARPGFGSNSLSFTLYDSYVPDICDTFFFSSRSVVLFSSPAATGSYPLSLQSNTVTLYDGETNYIVTSGSFAIDTLSDTAVGGSISASYDSSNSVAGEFSISRCDN